MPSELRACETACRKSCSFDGSASLDCCAWRDVRGERDTPNINKMKYETNLTVIPELTLLPYRTINSGCEASCMRPPVASSLNITEVVLNRQGRQVAKGMKR